MKINKQSLTRRSFLGKTVTLAAGLTLTKSKIWGSPAYIPDLLKHNSKVNGVQIGVITYSYRAIKDQSAEAILQYVLDSGVNAVELMERNPGSSGVAENLIGRPEYKIDRKTFFRLMRLDRKKEISRDEKKQLADLKQQQKSFEKAAANWEKNRNPNDFLKLRKMFNDAGVEIYAFKPDNLLGSKNSDADINYAMKAAKVLGASHVTLELPGPPYGPKNPEHTLRLGKLAEKNGIKVAYHGHTQQHINWWDTALEQSESNVLNPDLGHYIAAGNTDTFEFIKKFNKKIYSMHIKDRKSLENGQDNMPFGMGDTPITETLQLMRDNKYTFPTTIEYEYRTPKESSIIEEIKKCVNYCKNALDS